MNEQQVLARLREALEAAAGRRMVVPRDFERLSEQIFLKTHQKVSSTTLKRLWGYVKDGSMARESTLDILAQFLGHDDWQAFFHYETKEEPQQVSEPQPEQDPMPTLTLSPATKRYRWRLLAGLAALAVLAVLAWMAYSGMSEKRAGVVLHKGETFIVCDDYLRLFGITPTDTYWDSQLPHHQGIIVWSPQYQHRHWHNEGNADSLCPTITEYWTPTPEETDSLSDQLVRQKNENLFFTVMRTNELRITFMRGLDTDSTYTFLGVYRVDTSLSDSTHVIWERIADQLDLNNLDYLEQLRN